MFRIVLKKYARKVELTRMEPPFIWVERMMETHIPYGLIRHGNDLPSGEAATSNKTLIGVEWLKEVAKRGNLKFEYRKGVSKLEEHFWFHMDSLQDRGLLNETLVIFTSDHGELLGERILFKKGYGHGPMAPFCTKEQCIVSHGLYKPGYQSRFYGYNRYTSNSFRYSW